VIALRSPLSSAAETAWVRNAPTPNSPIVIGMNVRPAVINPAVESDIRAGHDRAAAVHVAHTSSQDGQQHQHKAEIDATKTSFKFTHAEFPFIGEPKLY
jgi:hypothetical protein